MLTIMSRRVIVSGRRLPQIQRFMCSSSDEHEDAEALPPQAEMFTPEEDALVSVTHDELADGCRTGVVLVHFNTPEKLNALTEDVGRVFQKKLKLLRTDNTIRALVLSGNGQAFSAGGDLDFLLDRIKESVTANQVTMRRFYDRYLMLRRLPFPTIAAINGAAVGAGCCLAMACDMRLASETAKLGFNFVRVGITPGMGATHFLPSLTNVQTASRLLLTGDLISAKEALQLGLVLSVHPHSEVLASSVDLARRIAHASPSAVRMVLQALRAKADEGLARTLDAEADIQAQSYHAGDLEEGIAAIREKRAPKFNDIV